MCHTMPEAGRPRPTQLLNVSELQNRLQLSRASIYRHVKAGRLPSPVRLGKHCRWVESEVEQFISGLAAARAA